MWFLGESSSPGGCRSSRNTMGTGQKSSTHISCVPQNCSSGNWGLEQRRASRRIISGATLIAGGENASPLRKRGFCVMERRCQRLGQGSSDPKTQGGQGFRTPKDWVRPGDSSSAREGSGRQRSHDFIREPIAENYSNYCSV